jgi:hypothetical protein
MLVVTYRHLLFKIIDCERLNIDMIWVLEAIPCGDKPHSWVVKICLIAKALLEIFFLIIVK